ncbi:hypothetical protein PVK06_026502 [Gossypium arboreum]|uniref:Uncharacterized protein n=1 Tax=Gossypium arboreum TaxID=29729 RepID=A0ABR0NZ49_GOSAR|nr:hypothetical protein PVK06_026502 [Gossypium arboreum]
MVSKLIDQNLREWKEDLITSIMYDEEATKVLNIHLSCHSHDDRKVRRGEATGEYTVRSGYKGNNMCNLGYLGEQKQTVMEVVERDNWWSEKTEQQGNGNR